MRGYDKIKVYVLKKFDLKTRDMLIAIRDEKAGNIEHIEMVRNLMALYYRTTIAFCENAIVSCKQFGDIKTKAKTCEYLRQVSNYMAEHLYLMTNCKISVIEDYVDLSDDILNNEWVQSFEKNMNINLSDIYLKFLTSKSYQSYITGWQYGVPSEYAILDINGDGYEELIITSRTGWSDDYFSVFSYDRTLDEIYVFFTKYYFKGLRYSPQYHALVFSTINSNIYIGFCDYWIIEDKQFNVDFTLFYERNYDTQEISYSLTDSGNSRIITEVEYDSYIKDLVNLEWKQIP